MPITIEARRDFVEGHVPMLLWFASKRRREGHPIEQTLSLHSNLYQLTDLYDGKHHMAWNSPPGWKDERWLKLVREFEAIHHEFARENDTAEVERRGYQLFQAHLEANLERDVREWPRLEDRPFGFFSYRCTDEFGAPTIELHMANAYAPQSPFADMEKRKEELARLVADASAAHPEAATITTGSWLNSFAPFLTLVPPEWQINSTPRRLSAYLSCWGQFMDRAGRFHHGNGRVFRETGKFPFANLDSWCTLSSLAKHLSQIGAKSHGGRS